jgi:DNA modification methylase
MAKVKPGPPRADKVEAWQNRIVGYDQVDPETLLANPNNWRIHSGGQQEALEGVLDTVGWVDDVIVNQRTGFVVDGHLRVSLALRHGMTAVPVKYVDLTEAEEALVLATLDPIGAMAKTDSDKLAELLKAAHEGSSLEMARVLEGIARQEHLSLFRIAPEGGEAEADACLAKWKVRPGDLWTAGSHHILCADASLDASFHRLMGADRAQLVWTDPPYGVGLGEKMETMNPQNYRVRSMKNDGLGDHVDLEALMLAALRLCGEFTTPGASLYLCAPAGDMLPKMIGYFQASVFDFRWQLVWVKNSPVLSRGDYQVRHENVLFGWKAKGKHYFAPDRREHTVFEFDKPSVSALHPTMKPIALVQRMVENSSRIGDVVLDPFGGSGTTGIACQQADRHARIMEIEPRYVAVTLERLSDMGLTPERAEGGNHRPARPKAKRKAASK